VGADGDGPISPKEAESLIDSEVRAGMFRDLVTQELLTDQKGLVAFTPESKTIARDVVRRHRLAERLLRDVLTMEAAQIDSAACRLEHVITSDVEGAICTLLGHPKPVRTARRSQGPLL